MSVKKISPNQISEIIVNNIKNPDIVFVFSTDISASTWAEWTVINSDKTGVKTVSLNRFIAWDDFKRQFVSANVQGKQAIPSLLRKIFVYDLIFQTLLQLLSPRQNCAVVPGEVIPPAVVAVVALPVVSLAIAPVIAVATPLVLI